MLNVFVYILVAIFGSSSWLSTNAIWMEISLYTQTNPEGWSLPSYLAAAIQLACVGPLLYSLIHKFSSVTVPKAKLIVCLLIFCALCLLVLAFCWKKTFFFFGAYRSVPLIMLTFFMAIVNATSNVLFLPHMSTFHPAYLTAYFVGMSFSSLIPSGVKLIQGISYSCRRNDSSIVEDSTSIHPLFHVKEYNLFMFGWLCLAIVSFVLLHWFYSDNNDKSCRKEDDFPNIEHDEVASFSRRERDPLRKRPFCGKRRESSQRRSESVSGAPPSHRKGKIRLFTQISCLAIISAEMNTIVPSIQSYAALPYSLMAYHLALTLNNISHPPANFLPLWLKPKQISFVIGLTILCSIMTTLIFVLALQSPTPFMHDHRYGAAIPVISSVTFGFTASYLRTHITGIVRSEHHDDESSLFWCGVFMQIGSFVGAFLMFPLVNIWPIFQKAPLPLCD